MKGILFSVAILLFAVSVFSAAFLVFQWGMVGFLDSARISLFDRIHDEFVSIQSGIGNIIRNYDTNITVANNTISLTENLPYAYSEETNNMLNNWETFVEERSGFDTDLSISDINSMPIYINTVKYIHHSDYGANKIEVENGSAVQAYSIEITYSGSGKITAKWEDTNPGDNSFYISVETSSDSYTSSKNLDFSKGNSLNIEIDNGTEYDIAIQIGKGRDPGYLRVDDGDRLPTTVTTNIIFAQAVTTVSTENYIRISENTFNVTKFSALSPV